MVTRGSTAQTDRCVVVVEGAVSRDPRCANFSGADCNALVREARLNCILPDLLRLEELVR